MQNDINLNFSNASSAIIIMAGGLGKRMNSDLPKVLHKIKQKPMIVHVIERTLELNVSKILIVVGKYYEIIKSTISEYIEKDKLDRKINFVIQKEPLGTGNAILSCKTALSKLPQYVNKVCILSGDVPLIKTKTINSMLYNFEYSNILISEIEDPTGYGRVIIKDNSIDKIVEEKDCNDIERKVKLINSGIYSFYVPLLLEYIDKLDNNNASKEYYLTQIFEILSQNRYSIDYTYLKNNREISGVNTKKQLDELEQLENLQI